MLKDYEVTGTGFVGEDGKPTKVGDTVQGSPRNGNIACGLRFKQLKAKGKAAKPAPEPEAAEEPAPAKKAAAKKPQR